MTRTLLLALCLGIYVITIPTTGWTEGTEVMQIRDGFLLSPKTLKPPQTRMQKHQMACAAFYQKVLEGSPQTPELLFDCIKSAAPRMSEATDWKYACDWEPVISYPGSVLGHKGCYYQVNFGDCVNPLNANGLLWAETIHLGRSRPGEVEDADKIQLGTSPATKRIGVVAQNLEYIEGLLQTCKAAGSAQPNNQPIETEE